MFGSLSMGLPLLACTRCPLTHTDTELISGMAQHMQSCREWMPHLVRKVCDGFSLAGMSTRHMRWNPCLYVDFIIQLFMLSVSGELQQTGGAKRNICGYFIMYFTLQQHPWKYTHTHIHTYIYIYIYIYIFFFFYLIFRVQETFLCLHIWYKK